MKTTGLQIKGVYSGGSVDVTMHGSDHKIKQPNGTNIEHIKHTEKEFGAFLLMTRPLYAEESEGGDTTNVSTLLSNKRSPAGIEYWPNPTKDNVVLKFASSAKQTFIKRNRYCRKCNTHPKYP